MLKHKIVQFVAFLAMILVLWNLLDFLYAKIFIKTAYQFTPWNELIMPLIVGSIMGYFIFLKRNR